MSDLAKNLARANEYLERFRRDGVLNHIGGKAVPAASGATFETISPIDRKVMAQVARGEAADVDAAARAAKTAFADWAAMPGAERRRVLHRIADGIVARAEEIAFVEAMDTGQAIRFMSKAALRGAENFPFLCRQGDRGARWPQPACAGAGQHDQPQPLGASGHHHALEHAFHAFHLEDRACFGGGLHGGA